MDLLKMFSEFIVNSDTLPLVLSLAYSLVAIKFVAFNNRAINNAENNIPNDLKKCLVWLFLQQSIKL